MIPLLALVAAAAPPVHKSSAGPVDQRSPQAHFSQCVKQSDRDPAAAVADAKSWAGSGGGIAAGQCLGIALSASGDFKGAADAFNAAASLASRLSDDRLATLWVSAGNASLAAGDADSARTALNNAIALPGMPPPLRGEAFLDRARACVALNDDSAARVDMNQALALVPDDPMAWLLSATLARRMDDLTRAAADIAGAESRAPTDPDVLFEDGTIAAAKGDMTTARARWAHARAVDPTSDTGKRAEAQLAASGGIPALPPQGR